MKLQAFENAVIDSSRAEIERLQGQVVRRLGGRVVGFRLQISDSGLVLQGRATTYYAKQLAQHAIMESTELPIVANDIEVS